MGTKTKTFQQWKWGRPGEAEGADKVAHICYLLSLVDDFEDPGWTEAHICRCYSAQNVTSAHLATISWLEK